MKKIFILLFLYLSVIVSNAQTPKPKFIEGSLMVFNNFNDKIGFGAVSPTFLKVNLFKKLTVGTSLAPIVWFNTQKNNHSFGQAGFVIRADYKRISVGCNLLTIAGADNKFIGIGIKL
jgi:hypothetical protein